MCTCEYVYMRWENIGYLNTQLCGADSSLWNQLSVEEGHMSRDYFWGGIMGK